MNILDTLPHPLPSDNSVKRVTLRAVAPTFAGLAFGALRRSSPPRGRGCETERMTIDKFYWPLSLGPDKQEDTKLSEAKEFIVRNNEASAPRDEGEFPKRCDSMLGKLPPARIGQCEAQHMVAMSLTSGD